VFQFDCYRPGMSAEPGQPGGRVVVVTGAASGIGHATAAMFAAAGDTVLGLDIKDTVPEGVRYVSCDLGDTASIRAAVDEIAPHGRLDVLANIAGIVQFGRVDTIGEDEWDRVQAVDLKGPFFLIQAALPLIRACTGTIVNVSSVAGRVPQPYGAAYAAAKGGLTMLTRSLALELAAEGIRVNCICPGTVDTPIIGEVATKLTPDLDKRAFDRMLMMLPGSIAPSEIAATVRFLTSPEARFITGAVIAHDGGMG
jgi:NAD(P)-dependent dehydrogenase (short-subunit alcohol dehydrogenase family)